MPVWKRTYDAIKLEPQTLWERVKHWFVHDWYEPCEDSPYSGRILKRCMLCGITYERKAIYGKDYV